MQRLRNIITALMVLFALTMSAKHLEFMGIPIDGSISTFQTKLLAKGCKLSKSSSTAPNGVREYTGTFAGKQCNIVVWYSVRTRQVYQVRAITQWSESKSTARTNFSYYKDLLKKKYGDRSLTSDFTGDTKEGDDIFYLTVYGSANDDYAQASGYIYLSVEELELDYSPNEYTVFVTYEDRTNSQKNENDQLNDL